MSALVWVLFVMGMRTVITLLLEGVFPCHFRVLLKSVEGGWRATSQHRLFNFYEAIVDFPCIKERNGFHTTDFLSLVDNILTEFTSSMHSKFRVFWV